MNAYVDVWDWMRGLPRCVFHWKKRSCLGLHAIPSWICKLPKKCAFVHFVSTRMLGMKWDHVCDVNAMWSRIFPANVPPVLGNDSWQWEVDHLPIFFILFPWFFLGSHTLRMKWNPHPFCDMHVTKSMVLLMRMCLFLRERWACEKMNCLPVPLSFDIHWEECSCMCLLGESESVLA